MSIIVPSSHTRIGAWVNSKMGGNLLVYCTISLIAMQGYRTITEYTGSLGYNSVCYITSRIGWVSLKGIFRYRCRRNPGKLYNTFCYTYSLFRFLSQRDATYGGSMYFEVCMYIYLIAYITAQSGPVILVILCHSH